MINFYFAIVIVIILIIVIAALVSIFSGQTEKDESIMKIENLILVGGSFVVIFALTLPFIILYGNNYEFTRTTFSQLGTVGDYFGGTTVGLLSFASLLFVASSMMMQKKELSLQRKEVTATRNEYEITNRTMKKQSFDSTFFNMINLHRSILNEINYENKNGRMAIEELYNSLKNNYLSQTKDKWLHQFWIDMENEERSLSKEVLDALSVKIKKLDIFDSHSFEYMELISDYEKNRDNFDKIHTILYTFDKLDVVNWRGFSFSKEYLDFEHRPKYEIKKYYYEKFYNDNESLIGHYFRNLYRIVKYIQEYEFTSNIIENEKEKKEYRGILRAQLSTYELLMLFYNVCYSDKGDKFKDILIGTNFFDNHLVQGEFIWKNDLKEITQFESEK